MSTSDIDNLYTPPHYRDRAIAAVLAADPVAAAAALICCENPDQHLTGVAKGMARMAPEDRDTWLDATLADLGGETPRQVLKDRDRRFWVTLCRNMPDWPAHYAAQRAEIDELLGALYPTEG